MQMGKNGALGAAAAVVLAGGRSRRMGRDKARLPWGDRSLLDHMLAAVQAEFDEVLLSAARPEDFPEAGVPIVTDAVPGAGPLAGVVAALEATRCDWVFAIACDMPYCEPPVWHALGARATPDADAVVPRTARGLEPLCAFYHRRCLEPFRRRLQTEVRALHEAVGDVRATIIEWEAMGTQAFENLNTLAEYERALTELNR